MFKPTGVGSRYSGNAGSLLSLPIRWLHVQWGGLWVCCWKWEFGRGYALRAGRPQSSWSQPIQC